MRWDAIPPATDPGKPSRPGPGRQGRRSGRALHLVTLALARSTKVWVGGRRDGGKAQAQCFLSSVEVFHFHTVIPYLLELKPVTMHFEQILEVSI